MNAAAVEQLTHLTADLFNGSEYVEVCYPELKGKALLLCHAIGRNPASAICHDASCVRILKLL
jgi:hypothetical protein